MPYNVNFQLSIFDNRELRPLQLRALYRLLECLVGIDIDYLKLHPLPDLYSWGVRYKVEPPGKEDWADIPQMLKQRWGDCEDLACARVAQLRLAGIEAKPIVNKTSLPNGATLFHIQVLWPYAMPERLRTGALYTGQIGGRVEDPSAQLGMQHNPHATHTILQI